MKIPEHCRDVASDFAEDYRLYVEGEQSIDRRVVNAVIADIASGIIENLRHIDGEITTTRFNERIIRTFPAARQHATIDSFEIEVDEVAYDAAGLPADEMEDVLAAWALARGEEIARREADRQSDMEADPEYTPGV